MPPRSVRTTATLAALVLTGLAAGSAQAQSLVVPNANATTEANASGEGPFAAFGIRYQQVYGAGEFGGTTPLRIDGLSFRPDESVVDAFSTTRGDADFPVNITLSTTSRAVDDLTQIFDFNTGPDGTQVFSGSLTFTGGPATGPGPRPFLAQIDFTTPFTFDPSAGNLLVDFQKFSADLFADPLQLDVADDASDGVSSLTGLSPLAAQGLTDTTGLVTAFDVTPIPSPAAGLGAVALLGLSAVRRRRVA